MVLSEPKGSGPQRTQPGTGFWVTRYMLMILGWEPPSVRLVTLFVLTSVIYLKYLNWNVVSAAIASTALLINLMFNRAARLLLTVGELALLLWLGPAFIKDVLFNHAVFLIVYLVSLGIVPGSEREEHAGRN